MKKIKLLFSTLVSCTMLIILPVFWMVNAYDVFNFSTAEDTSYTPTPWPPILNKPYPDLELIDQSGELFKLSYLKGKVIIVEPIGMNCPSCQAFSGGHDYGSFKNNPIEQHSKSFRRIFPYYAKGLKLPSNDVVFVQLLLYDMDMNAPGPKDAQEWAKHFHIYKKHNHFVAVSPHDLRSSTSFSLIPGFQLIDRDFVLRADSTGHRPMHNLYKQLIPLTPKLVKQKVIL